MREFELAENAASLEAASKAATGSLGLKPGEFDWFTGEVRHAMSPQSILPESTTELDYYTDNVTFYGGGIANEAGNFGFGHIQASIDEPLEGKHQAGEHQSPVPYIPRLLTVKNGIITVDTPTKHAPVGEGPVVVEGLGRNPRFRKTTKYDTRTGLLTVRSGQLITDGHGWVDDRTIEQDASELPEDILAPRVATVLRTMKATATIFEKIAWKDDGNVKVKVVRSSKR
ncbi:MAG: hypothetical protein H0W89_03780 [Candidatus Levybacteria bacterium]|nr:hypothetical protein [Candidatus Levybacteria bacterium]